jgi:OOP family OmpA-OmpF porin
VGALSVAGFAAVSAPPAAAEDSDSNWYGGISVGQSRANIDNERISSQLRGSSLTTTTISDDEKDIGFKLFGGRTFNKYFAIEGGYFNLGKFSFTAQTLPAGSLTGETKFQGLNLDAVGILPITQKFSASARIGGTYTEAKGTYSGTGAVSLLNAAGVNAVGKTDPKKTEAGYKFGAGLQYDFTRSLAVRAEAERYRVNDAVGNKGDIDLLSVGLIYTFGRTEKAAPRAETPPPVAAAAPVLVIVPIARTQQYCSILDIQFEINQTTVQRESEEKLNKVVTFMQKYPDTTAVIEGHTDEVGTSADNMRLSQTRADNAVNYLARRGINRSRLKAVGYGETRPIADNSTEIGKRLNRRIDAVIACATDVEGIAPIPDRVTMALEMEFDTNSAAVRPQYREPLRKVANLMKANPRATATVEGHTSNMTSGSSAQAAKDLSLRRADSVVNYLVTQFGVDRTMLFAEGFGATRRFAYNTSADGQQENRRVNIILDSQK